MKYIVLFSLLVAGFYSLSVSGLHLSNLSPVCLRCICHASSNCNMTIGCYGGRCGPLQISRQYWKDAGRYVLPEDNPNRDGAFLDCAEDHSCATQILKHYIIAHGKDCNHDGITDCDDYAMLHFNLKSDCTVPIDATNFGLRYSTCRPTASLDDDDDII
ncbi:uncharacterized protein LOC111058614 [Nilaparvata lugens]|uniref:lysozyme n=1 Tax=Nilaparvata lugens TaxID=108931 RepID=M9ZV91_NILLU|nr:uncharacterized protein LOC111058614 [Nilaparvata lugens]AGK40905.1 i-type lysozyme 2 [Nilaparvata lugens]